VADSTVGEKARLSGGADPCTGKSYFAIKLFQRNQKTIEILPKTDTYFSAFLNGQLFWHILIYFCR
jgi:hypothetical protein